MDRVLLSEATSDQLRAFAELSLGLSVPAKATTPVLIALIGTTGYNQETIPVLGTQPKQPGKLRPVAPRSAPEATQIAPDGQEIVYIMISRTEEPGGDRPVELGVNGSIMLVPRGARVPVPKPYVEVLEHAEKHVYEPAFDSQGRLAGMNPIPRKVPAYPWSYA